MTATPDSPRGIRRIVAATRYSMAGLRAAWQNEEAFRLEVIAAVVLIPAAFWVGTTAVERALLIGSILLVMIVELMNAAIENTIDRIGTERHELSGRAKDQGSAAVLVSLVLVAMTWGMVVLARLGDRFG
ncbi:MAG: diacylglycerol kinase [Gammaproteobacteria bacterium]